MSNDMIPLDDVSTVKPAFEPSALREHGSVEKLTEAGNGSASDGGAYVS